MIKLEQLLFELVENQPHQIFSTPLRFARRIKLLLFEPLDQLGTKGLSRTSLLFELVENFFTVRACRELLTVRACRELLTVRVLRQAQDQKLVENLFIVRALRQAQD